MSNFQTQPSTKPALADFIQKHGFGTRYNLGNQLIYKSQDFSPKGGPETYKMLRNFELSLHLISVTFDSRIKVSLGNANARRIKLHPALQKQQFRHEFEETFFHELAHTIVAHRWPEEHHGTMWQWTFACFGFVPRRCHDVPRSMLKYTALDKHGISVDDLDLDLE